MEGATLPLVKKKTKKMEGTEGTEGMEAWKT
jgi:hypothetical protein